MTYSISLSHTTDVVIIQVNLLASKEPQDFIAAKFYCLHALGKGN